MFVLDITNFVTVLLLVMFTVLLIFLGRELKKSYITAIPLFTFLGLLVIHQIQWLTLAPENRYMSSTLSGCVVLDLAFIFVSFISYLWVDDIEAKAKNKKSIDNSLEWFWKEV